MAGIITKSQVVADVPDTWARQYDARVYRVPEEHKEITAKLRGLPKGFTAEQVEEIIGNKSWTRILCEECEEEVDAVAEFKSGERFVHVCEVCIRKAGIAIRAARKAGA
ncbi:MULTISPECIES: hypothetical protein [unclassified Agrobacterium]|uniref:hypothetical protein n=1 Tax=unclassified Agrobacterium TaxID=2632611 RepID=UPI00069A0759|nr:MULTISPECIES: hypothetical protein [unclassified Agrobacterium]KNY36054.1 hypothetical protein AKG12_03410 [Agrobacterium sp. SUL3]MCD4663375.1 hypothetical protein [Agrobacterium sp.]